MNLGLWIAAVGGLWFVSSVVLALILGPILQRRGEQLVPVYADRPSPSTSRAIAHLPELSSPLLQEAVRPSAAISTGDEVLRIPV